MNLAEDEPEYTCGCCGKKLTLVRPGKHQCDFCGGILPALAYSAWIKIQNAISNIRGCELNGAVDRVYELNNHAEFIIHEALLEAIREFRGKSEEIVEL